MNTHDTIGWFSGPKATAGLALVALLGCVGLVGCEVDPSGALAGGDDGGAWSDGGAPDGGAANQPTQHHDEDDKATPISGGVGALILADGEALELRHIDVSAAASAGMAALTITHTFHNPLSQQLEGTFRFAVPPGAIVTGLRMETDGKWIAGEIVGRRKAERIYRKIVDSMRDPALLRWQGGGRLELRVFPIPAQADKRLALDLLVPVRSDSDGTVMRYGLGGELQDTTPIDRVTLRTDGAIVFDEVGVDRTRVVTLRFGAGDQGDDVWLEAPDGPNGKRYVAAALQLPAAPRQEVSGSRTVVVLVDRSRSSLGTAALQQQIVRAVLAAGAATDHFVVAATDITCRADPAGFLATDDRNIDAALAWLGGVTADGASDLGGALGCAKGLLASGPAGHPQVVLVSDGVATWGALEDAALVTLAQGLAAPVFCAAVGRSTAMDTLTALARASAGRVFVPRSAQDAETLGRTVASAPSQGRWRDVRLAAVGALRGGPLSEATTFGAAAVRPAQLGTVFEGQRPWVVLEVAAGEPLPEAIAVSVAGRATPLMVPLMVPLATPRPATGLRQRFGAAAVAALQTAGAPAEAVVAVSRGYGVLSKHTALLVLESEEAYARHGIERASAQRAQRAHRRRQQAENPGGPTVSGADLESLASGPTVSPDRIQPGDPEVRIPAPRDARSVTVTLPWGEVLHAQWEPASDHGPAAWVARFLVDLAVPEGRYPLMVTVVQQSGAVTQQQLWLTIDTTAPSLRLSVRRHPRRRGVFILRARQLAPLAARDARGVEVRLPDGQVVALKALRLGVFVGHWRPLQRPTWPLRIELFAIDRALNQRSAVLTLAKSGAVVAMGAGRLDVLPRASLVGDLRDVHVPPVGRDITALTSWRGGLVAGTLTDGLWLRQLGGAWRRLPTSGDQHRTNDTDAPIDRRINRLAAGPDGTLWVATARGLSRIDAEGRARSYGVADGLPASDVHSVWVSPRRDDAASTISAIVGTAHGAALMGRNGDVTPLGAKQGLPVRAVWDLTRTDDGAIWLASSWGVYRWTKTDVQRFSVATGHLRDDWVTALATDGRSVFVGTYRGGVIRLDPVSAATTSPAMAAATFEATPCGGVHINLGGLHVQGGALWAATMEGALRVALAEKSGVLRPAHAAESSEEAEEPSPAANVTAIGHHLDATWFGTRNGVTTSP